MSIPREKMKYALLEWVVPFLKEEGFQGNYPNYYRVTIEETDLITFQFSIFMDAFCVNVAKCSHDGIIYKDGHILPPQKVCAHFCPQRLRLGAREMGSQHWFTFNPHPYELHNQGQYSANTIYKDTLLKYTIIAKEIIALLKIQAESWWHESEAWWTKEEKPIYNKLFMDIQRLVNH